MFGIDFYPTPATLVERMCAKVNWDNVVAMLEPSAGKGDLLKGATQHMKRYDYKSRRYLAAEIDPALQAVLRNLTVVDEFNRKEDLEVDIVDSDFLAYPGGDAFDLIMMNPPFSAGDLHLLHAIDIMYQGQIVCLLNAETLRNPHTNTRKLLARKLDELGAQVEYIQCAFKDAERRTDVEVALIYISIEQNVEHDLFKGTQDNVEEIKLEDLDSKEVVKHNDIDQRIERYHHDKAMGIDFLKKHYKVRKHLGNLIRLENDNACDNLSPKLLGKNIHEFTAKLREKYWLGLLDSPQINQKLTTKSRNEYTKALKERSRMEFNLLNIQTVFLNLQTAYMGGIERAIMDMFDELSREYAWSNEFSNNIYLFNGWKTNKSWKVNNKVILPHFNWLEYDRWCVPYTKEGMLNDLDKVMSYFDGGRTDYMTIAKAVEKAFKDGQTRKIESSYFEIDCFKKGTIHLRFKDEGILRRFNVFAAQNRGWLPPGYGSKPTADMTDKEREVVKAFDGKLENYQLLPTNQELLRLAA